MKHRGARLGQHFLTNPHPARLLAGATRIKPGETVLEIGPGTGALTKELLATEGRVIAIEKDEALVGQLKKIFAVEIASGALTLIGGDVRDFSPGKYGLARGGYVLAANIPYYITGEIIRQFLETEVPPRVLALLIQKEVAERILARDKKESILSISVKAYGTPSIVAKVSRGNFSPPPSVDSAILLIENVSKDFFSHVTEKDFFTIVRAGFSSKRKFLVSNLGSVFGKTEALGALQQCGLNEKIRAEDVPLAAWKHVAEKLIAASEESK
jgi:16S rRNA (adenine1518-N6/adenine1519-N6)-dimethyltransferase